MVRRTGGSPSQRARSLCSLGSPPLRRTTNRVVLGPWDEGGEGAAAFAALAKLRAFTLFLYPPAVKTPANVVGTGAATTVRQGQRRESGRSGHGREDSSQRRSRPLRMLYSRRTLLLTDGDDGRTRRPTPVSRRNLARRGARGTSRAWQYMPHHRS